MLQKLHSKKDKGFTLVEIMIVVAIIALLAAIAVPSFLRARLRSQATTVLNEMRMIDAAKDQYMIENNVSSLAQDSITAAMLQPYLKEGSSLYNALGTGTASRMNDEVTISYGDSNELPSVDVPDAMLEVAPADTFWSPYSAI